MNDEQKYKPLDWDLNGDKTAMVHALKEQMEELIEFIEGPSLKYYGALNNEEFYNLVEFRVGKVLQNMRVGLGIESVDTHLPRVCNMFCVTGNSVYLAHKEEVLWPETRSPQVRSTVFSMS